MDQSKQDIQQSGVRQKDDRVVVVIPEGGGRGESSLSLLELGIVLWHGKWVIVLITLASIVISVVWALNATKWYEASVLLAPAEERTTPSLGGALGGLASLAGVSVGGESVEALAVLRSREFTRRFIEDQNLLPILFDERWDHEKQTWLPGKEPDIREAVRYFHDNVLSVTEDDETRLATLSIEWRDPKLAAEWANTLVRRLNEQMRQRALREAASNVSYLQEELSKTQIVTLQQSIGRLLESELQKLMLARGNEEFAFRVIDAAQVPRDRSRPKRTAMVILSTMAGGMASVLVVLLGHAAGAIRRQLKSSRPVAATDDR